VASSRHLKKGLQGDRRRERKVRSRLKFTGRGEGRLVMTVEERKRNSMTTGRRKKRLPFLFEPGKEKTVYLDNCLQCPRTGGLPSVTAGKRRREMPLPLHQGKQGAPGTIGEKKKEVQRAPSHRSPKGEEREEGSLVPNRSTEKRRKPAKRINFGTKRREDGSTLLKNKGRKKRKNKRRHCAVLGRGAPLKKQKRERCPFPKLKEKGDRSGFSYPPGGKKPRCWSGRKKKRRGKEANRESLGGRGRIG